MDRVLCGMSFHLATSSLERLADWFGSTTGQRLLAEQSPHIAECARRFHGDTLLWAGCHTDLTDTVRGCMVRHRFHLETCAANGDCPEAVDTGRFRADLHELPVANNTFDAVVLHHVLETAEDPRTAIREVARTLAPGGRLLIVAFNPWSLWGLRSAYARFFQDSFSGLRFFSPARLVDWLTVLGFELQQDVKYLAYELPFNTRNKDAGIWRKFRDQCASRRLPVGGVYVISAVKQVNAVRPDWAGGRVRGRKLAGAAYPKLSARVAYLPVRSGGDGGGTLAPRDGIEDPG